MNAPNDGARTGGNPAWAQGASASERQADGTAFTLPDLEPWDPNRGLSIDAAVLVEEASHDDE